jgi:hypothetical protein
VVFCSIAWRLHSNVSRKCRVRPSPLWLGGCNTSAGKQSNLHHVLVFKNMMLVRENLFLTSVAKRCLFQLSSLRNPWVCCTSISSLVSCLTPSKVARISALKKFVDRALFVLRQMDSTVRCRMMVGLQECLAR